MNTLFDENIEFNFPPKIFLEGNLASASFKALASTGLTEPIRFSEFRHRGLSGFEGESAEFGKFLVLPKKTTAALPDYSVLLAQDITSSTELRTFSEGNQATWMRPKPTRVADLPISENVAYCDRVVASWENAFVFSEEKRDEAGSIVSAGLRPPQIGALHALLAHWSVSERPATIVMPTGTGKTETMLAIMTAASVSKVLVVVPNAALRDQIAEKFETLGILKKAGALKASAMTPVVAKLKSRPTNADEVQTIFQRANVVVTTMQVAGQCDEAVQKQMAHECSHLFIDEAHHIGARTWQSFRNRFDKKRVVQFTATPFRTDGRKVDGKFIYVYPLSKAQREGYFKPIKFRPIQGLDEERSDDELIRQVGDQLRSDLADGFDHLAMARAKNINRAIDLHRKYAQRLAEFNPVLIHSRMNQSEKQEALSALWSRQSRIIICVDMLGEGFDLPQLKIAGIHDKHKSLAITLQFTGRFTRESRDIGDATVIANIEQGDVEDALRGLYAEDADWNFLLSVLSERKTGRQLLRAEIMEGFQDSLEGIPLQTLVPKMSTVVYKTQCEEWRPQDCDLAMPTGTIHTGPIINEEQRLAIFVTREDLQVRWSNSKEVTDTEWNLYLLHWDPETKLLYINSSKSKDLHEKLALAVGGDRATRVQGEHVYRVLQGINRLILMNLGLSSLLGKHVRYTMYAGSDITRQLSDAQYSAKRKSNLFGLGYDGTGKTTIGCSAKGKFWSMKSAADFSLWLEWCHEVGAKVTDDTIQTDDFVRNLVKQEIISARPANKAVLAVHWPDSVLIELEERLSIRFGEGEEIGFFDCEIEPANFDPNGPLEFIVRAKDQAASFRIDLSETGATYTQIAGPRAYLLKGKALPLDELFADDPPHLFFADGDFLIFNELFTIPRDEERLVFAPDKIETREWTGTDLQKESQGLEKHEDSIQRRIINELLGSETGYEVIFDDDGTGEIADIVALKEQDGRLDVYLYHLKYSHGAAPGNRVADLYEVCGQAQKSVRWMEYPVRVLKRMRKRELDRIQSGRPSRFERGSLESIRDLINRWKDLTHHYHVWIVQPGLSKAGIEPAQSDLLAATESYLLETYSAPLKVISSS